jgi:toxin YoeB
LEKYRLVFTKRGKKDLSLINTSKYRDKAHEILALLEDDPFKCPPDYEALCGDLKSAFSRRINRQHRVVYQVFKDEKYIKILMMWTHY